MDLPHFIDIVLRPRDVAVFPEDCWLRRASNKGSGYLPSIETALDIVHEEKELAGLVQRGQKQHDSHTEQADRRFNDVLTEAAGFAFGVRVLGRSLTFSDDIGKPDFVGRGCMGEAKSIHPPQDRSLTSFCVGSVPEKANYGLSRKIESSLDRAYKQVTYAQASKAFIFLNILAIEPVIALTNLDSILADLQLIARQFLSAHRAVSTIGLCWNYEWEKARVISR